MRRRVGWLQLGEVGLSSTWCIWERGWWISLSQSKAIRYQSWLLLAFLGMYASIPAHQNYQGFKGLCANHHFFSIQVVELFAMYSNPIL